MKDSYPTQSRRQDTIRNIQLPRPYFKNWCFFYFLPLVAIFHEAAMYKLYFWRVLSDHNPDRVSSNRYSVRRRGLNRCTIREKHLFHDPPTTMDTIIVYSTKGLRISLERNTERWVPTPASSSTTRTMRRVSTFRYNIQTHFHVM